MFTSKQSNEIDKLVNTASMGTSASKFITLKSWQVKLREYPMGEVNHAARHNDRLELSLLSFTTSLCRSLGFIDLPAEGMGCWGFSHPKETCQATPRVGVPMKVILFSHIFNIQVIGGTLWAIDTWHLDFIITSCGGKQTMIFWII